MSIQGVVFDFDNTIIKTPTINLIFSPKTAVLWKSVKDTCDHFRGYSAPNLRVLLNKHLQDHHQLEDALDDFDQSALKYCFRKNLIKEVQELISFLDAYNIPRAILSDHPCIDKIISLNMESGWSAIINCQNYNALKPLPYAMFSLAAQLDLPLSESLFIGDRFDTDGLLSMR